MTEWPIDHFTSNNFCNGEELHERRIIINGKRNI
jgi:hypothetical protein